MSFSLDPTMKHQIDGMVRDLCSEFAGQFERAQIEEVMNDSVERVVETATVFDFVPLMAYRFTRERLNATRRAQRQDAQGAWDRSRGRGFGSSGLMWTSSGYVMVIGLRLSTPIGGVPSAGEIRRA